MNKLGANYWREVFAKLPAVFDKEKPLLCQLDGAIGDGDHGASMARGFAEANSQLSSLPNPQTSQPCFKPPATPFSTRSGASPA